jgi:hypothetical protein
LDQSLQMASKVQIRRIILTGSIAAITATGALYGAGLKTKQEWKQVWTRFPSDRWGLGNLPSNFLLPCSSVTLFHNAHFASSSSASR